jgi:shikimate dehydrogenase
MAEAGRYFELGLIGWPLEHSLSPFIHGEFLRASGLAGRYRVFPVKPGRLGERLGELLEEGVTGLNVTFPHKKEAAGLCGELAGSAAGLNAVNTISCEDGVLRGHNTDTYGFGCYLDHCGLEEPFLVAGCGGAALAVDMVLHERGLPCSVFCRDPGRWRGLAKAAPLEELEDAARGSSRGTLVNATTLGWDNGDEFPVSGRSLEGMVFADLNYNRSWAWRNRLADISARVHTGEVMLVSQAARSFEIWTGMMPEIENLLKITGSSKGSGENIGN